VLSVLKWLVVRLAAVRWIIKTLASLGILLPLAWLFKFIGLPILGVLGILALPVLFLLFIFGLPIFMVLIVGGGVLGLLFALLSLGILALKIGVLVVLPIFVVYKVFSWIFGRPRRNGDAGGSSGSSSTSSTPPSEPIDGVDPL
jgi:hypothetical protein